MFQCILPAYDPVLTCIFLNKLYTIHQYFWRSNLLCELAKVQAKVLHKVNKSMLKFSLQFKL